MSAIDGLIAPEGPYTRIGNLLLEALPLVKLNRTQESICIFLWRRTYGWNRTRDAITLTDFANACGNCKEWVSKQIKALMRKRIIRRLFIPGRPAIYSFVADTAQWEEGCIDLEALERNRKSGTYRCESADMIDLTAHPEARWSDQTDGEIWDLFDGSVAVSAEEVDCGIKEKENYPAGARPADIRNPESTSGSNQDKNSYITQELNFGTTQILDPSTTKELNSKTTQELNPRTTQELNPRTTQELNPRTTQELNPRTTQELNPRTTQELNSRTTQELKPRTTQELNARTTQELNPKTTQELKPRTTQELKPRTTQELNPTTTQELNPRTTQELNDRTTPEQGPAPPEPAPGPPLNTDLKTILKTDGKTERNIKEFTPDMPQHQLATLLWTRIKANIPTFKEPDMQNWSRAMDRLLTSDKIDLEVLREVIIFSQDDEFWLTTIHSPSSLRKSFYQLDMQRRRERFGPRAPIRPGGKDDWRHESDEYAHFFA